LSLRSRAAVLLMVTARCGDRSERPSS
jgi:hypothetical protein